MGLLEFSKLPVNTLVGADWKTFKEMTRGQEIAPDKRTKYYLTKSVCRLLSLLAPIQDRRFEEKLGGVRIRPRSCFHSRTLEKRDDLCAQHLCAGR